METGGEGRRDHHRLAVFTLISGHQEVQEVDLAAEDPALWVVGWQGGFSPPR
jgi:hypothetical protein